MHVIHGRVPGQPTQQRTATFTGVVYQDLVLDAPDVLINSVVFTPGARTYWHRHPGGQLLIVTTGRGLVASRGGEVHLVGPGDVIWADPGEEHWHGAVGDSVLVHTAVSHGPTEWHAEVGATEYGSAGPA